MSATDKIANLVLAMVMDGIMSGLSYHEGMVAFRCALFLMEEVHRNRNADEGFLAEQARMFIAAELNK